VDAADRAVAAGQRARRAGGLAWTEERRRNIDITDEAIAISGERRQEQESENAGVYRSERSYGSFYRTIPLPRGAISDQAKATFKDGVLEIRVPAPPDQVTRGRRIEIQDASQQKK
jgi:HSP20 family protein